LLLSPSHHGLSLLLSNPVSASASLPSILIGPFHLSAIICTTVQFYVECALPSLACVRSYKNKKER
jgi:hypothetical protein